MQLLVVQNFRDNIIDADILKHLHFKSITQLRQTTLAQAT